MNALRRREPTIAAVPRGGDLSPSSDKGAPVVLQQCDRIRDVADDRAGRRVLSGAASDVERRADDIALDGDRIEHAADIRDDIAFREQRRMHAHGEFVVRKIARDDREQLDAEAERGGMLENPPA